MCYKSDKVDFLPLEGGIACVGNTIGMYMYILNLYFSQKKPGVRRALENSF